MAVYENAHDFFKKRDEPESLAYVLNKKSTIYMRYGKQRQAQKAAEKALKLYRQQEFQRGQLQVLVNLANIILVWVSSTKLKGIKMKR